MVMVLAAAHILFEGRHSNLFATVRLRHCQYSIFEQAHPRAPLQAHSVTLGECLEEGCSSSSASHERGAEIASANPLFTIHELGPMEEPRNFGSPKLIDKVEGRHIAERHKSSRPAQYFWRQCSW